MKSNVKGYWKPTERDMNAWIARYEEHAASKGVSGVLGKLEGEERWSRSLDTCLQIDDVDGTGTAEELAEEEPVETESDIEVQVAAWYIGGQDNAHLEDPEGG